VLSRQNSRPKRRQESASGRYEKPAAIPQIVRQRWIIFSEFVVSFTFTHITMLRLSD
jgi:hypothetical protein